MAKKNPKKKKSLSSSKKGKGSGKKPSAKKKYTGKKRGRKSSVPNRYNSLKQAISLNYEDTVGRKIKRYELKILYDWMKDVYGNQSIRYVLMNIDVIIDNFWQEYCNLYPVDINNHARFFEWYNLKTYLNEERGYHYPTDIIELDLTAIGQGVLDFFYEEYPTKAEEVYEICKSEGIKRESPPPAFYLVSAVCDIAKKGNVFKYKLLLDTDIPVAPRPSSVAQDVKLPEKAPLAPTIGLKQPETLVPQQEQKELTPQQINIEIEKERIKQEFLLREQKLKELAQLLKEGIITFQQYMEAIKGV